MSVISLEEWRNKRDKISKLTSQSKPNTSSEEPGQTPIDVLDQVDQLVEFWLVLDHAARKPFTVKSTTARQHAWHIAVCASRGFLTTEIDFEMFSNKWNITEDGMDFLEAIDERITELL